MSRCKIQFKNNKLYLQHNTEMFNIGFYIDFDEISTEDIKNIIINLQNIVERREQNNE